jgi:transposase
MIRSAATLVKEGPMPHIQGVSRDAVVLFPSSLDEYIGADNPVRFLDAFVDQLDLQVLGFARVIAANTGRPPYAPGDLLKLYVYGYLNRVRSSRRLECEAQRNVEVMWLLKKLTPDYKTIADFRAVHPEAIKAVCREFTELCKTLDLFGGELVAIDGSKFRAVNSRKRNFTPASLKKRLSEIKQRIDEYLHELDRADAETPAAVRHTADELRVKIDHLRRQQTKYEAIQQRLEASGESQLSLTDSDSRRMPSDLGTEIAYNVQTAVDSKHHLIVEYAVTNAVTDQGQLLPMAIAAQTVLDVETLEAVSDKGYYDGEQVQQCETRGITVYMAKPHTSRNRQQGLFTKEDFVYEAERDRYCCPAGEVLTYRFSTVEDGRPMRYYESSVCRACPLKLKCTRNKRNRRITRAGYEGALDRMALRVRNHPEIMPLRMQLAEHPFGTLKRAWHHGFFLCRGLKKVAAEMSLSVMAYNLKRAVNILGVPKLIAALRERYVSAPNIVLHFLRTLVHGATRHGNEFSHNLRRG